MIKSFEKNSKRDSAIIYTTCYERAQELLKINPQQAGEYALAVIQLAFTGETTTDDPYIRLMLNDTARLMAKAQEKYDTSSATKRQKAMEKMQLEEIAAMYLNGATQQIIANTLGEKQQTISNRLKIIKKDYPELLQQ